MKREISGQGKKYSSPTIEVVELRPEERIAGSPECQPAENDKAENGGGCGFVADEL